MYHYVRDLKNSKYPEIKGLDVSDFKNQINYLGNEYNIITMDQLIWAINGLVALPEKSLLLTFDDGYADHYEYVFPILKQYNIQGSFYPSAKAILEHEVLDVNKIHFILAACSNTELLLDDLKALLDDYKKDYSLKDYNYYYEKLAFSNRFDTPEVIFFKRLLQVELNEELRGKITNFFFKKYVSTSESGFSKELYLNTDQIKIMLDNGMHFGSHGYAHYWLDSLSPKKQLEEINKSLSFLGKLGCDLQNWTMCYPYGAYDASVMKILKEKHCSLAFTTNVATADISSENRHALSRYDTNDIPTKPPTV